MVDLPITKWIKKKIRRLIAIVEDTDTAVHSIVSGKYVVWKGDLYKSTAAIAVGGSLSLSNLSPVSDGGLNELSEQITTLSNKTIYPVKYIYTDSSQTQNISQAIKKLGLNNYESCSFIIYWAGSNIYFGFAVRGFDKIYGFYQTEGQTTATHFCVSA